MNPKPEKKCNYCETPNCKLPCHNSPKPEKKARIELLYKEPFLLVKQKSSLEKYRLLFMKLSLKINEIIKVLNSR